MRVTIDADATKSSSLENRTRPEGEEAKIDSRSVVPSLNLDKDNLRKKTSEKMKQDVKRIKQE